MVTEDQATPSLAREFQVLRHAPELVAERQQFGTWLAATPDKALALVAEMDDFASPQKGTGPVVYACPMHPEVVSEQPGRCPECGMKLLPAQVVAQAAAGHDPAAMEHDLGHDATTMTAATMPMTLRRCSLPSMAMTTAKAAATAPPTGSSGKTTWWRSTG